MDGREQEYVLDTNDYAIKEVNGMLSKTFTRMFTGLLLTAVVALLTIKTGFIVNVIRYYLILALLEIGLVIAFSLGFRKMSPGTVTALYYGYAALNGVTLSTIFLVYNIGLIGKSFIMTALLFGALAYYGHTTEKDLSKFGTILSIALIVGLVATIINVFFLKSTMFDIALDWIMLLIFSGLTMYDMNRMKAMSSAVEADGASADKIYVYCAMQLYLDFINIFLRLLRLLGRSNRR